MTATIDTKVELAKLIDRCVFAKGMTQMETAEILAVEFDVVRALPAPRPGELYRNRRSGRLVRVRAVEGSTARWRCVDGSRGPITGSAYVGGWHERFERVDEDQNNG